MRGITSRMISGIGLISIILCSSFQVATAQSDDLTNGNTYDLKTKLPACALSCYQSTMATKPCGSSSDDDCLCVVDSFFDPFNRCLWEKCEDHGEWYSSWQTIKEVCQATGVWNSTSPSGTASAPTATETPNTYLDSDQPFMFIHYNCSLICVQKHWNPECPRYDWNCACHTPGYFDYFLTDSCLTNCGDFYHEHALQKFRDICFTGGVTSIDLPQLPATTILPTGLLPTGTSNSSVAVPTTTNDGNVPQPTSDNAGAAQTPVNALAGAAMAGVAGIAMIAAGLI